jgi:hypothetical protein
MNRRGFLGASAGAAIAGPEAVHAAMDHDEVSLNADILDTWNENIGKTLGAEVNPEEYFARQLEDLRKGATFLRGLTYRDYQDDMGLRGPARLDPDIKALKSFSRVAKQRLQEDRDFAQWKASRMRGLLSRARERLGIPDLSLEKLFTL